MQKAKSKPGDLPTASSIIDKIARKHVDEDRQQQIIDENIKEFRDALNRLAASPDGCHVLRKLKLVLGIDAVQPRIDPAAFIAAEANRAVWLKMFKPHLDATNQIMIDHDIDLTKMRK